MKKLWKIYDVTLFFIIFAVIVFIVTMFYNISFALMQLVVIITFILCKYVYYKKRREKLLFQINSVSDEIDFEHGRAFEKLSVPCVVVEENGSIIWLNESFKSYFSITDQTKSSNIKDFVRKESLDKLLKGYGFRVKVDTAYFAVYSSLVSENNSEKIYLLYFFDETRLRKTEKEYYDTRISIMHIVIDNADEIYQKYKESECAAIFGQISQIIDNWASEYSSLCRTVSNDRMFVIVEEKHLQRMMNEKFSILEQIRQFTYVDRKCDLTLSIGVGKDDDLNKANNSARQALEMAQSRGGDQVAVKNEAHYKFYGGVSGGREKKTKVKTRLVAKTMAQIIEESDNVLIVGHRFSDFDCFGGSVGMFEIVSHFERPVKIVVNTSTTLARPLVEKFISLKGYESLVLPADAPELVGENTLVIVVDTHRKEFTDCPELLDKADKIMVIDHHRKSVDFIDETVMFYHMPGASSACEMITEISQYIDSVPVIDEFSALSLLSGIMLDTRNFILRSGVRTFEAAAYLRSRGAGTVDSKKLFSTDMEIFRRRNSIIDNAYRYEECAISVCSENIENIRLITSQAADEMLNIEGIKASFVIYENMGAANISARSYGEINVQLIMEGLGGGGHQTMAACQLKDCDIKTAEEKLKTIIDQIYE